MELHQIRAFLTVAKYQHMTRAANELMVSQPALSKTIKSLEDDLGLPLFDRVGNKIQLNQAGQIFLDYAREIQAATENVRIELHNYQQTGNDTICIAQNLSYEDSHLAVIGFRKLYPNVHFEFSPYLNTSEGIPLLHDFSIFCTAQPIQEPDCRTILEERIQLGVPLDSPLAARESITLREAADNDFIFTHPFHSALNDIMFMQCALRDCKPRILTTVPTKDDAIYLLQNGTGVVFAPEMTWYYMSKQRGFALVPISDADCRRCINLRWKTKGYISKASALFRAYLLEFARQRAEEVRRENHLDPEP